MAEENDYYKFTILGETGSGKTCYLLGMYFEMSMGVAGYTIITENADDDKNLATRYEMLNDKARGQSRFPYPSDNVQKYYFDLQYAYETILPFEWIDYPGGWLDPKSKNVNDERYQQVEKNIRESSMLFICIDGDNLRGSNINRKIRNVKMKCAKNIGPYLGSFNGNLPPIAMVVTKYDLCEADTSPAEVKEIIEEAFESLFQRDDVFVAIIPVSLGATLQDDNYSGELEPLNVHLPILMGINFALIKEMELGKKLIGDINGNISDAKRARDKEKDSFFLWRDDDFIRDMEKYIEKWQHHLEEIREIAKYFKKSADRINRDLEEIDLIFMNGSWQDRRTIRKMWEDLQSVTEYF